MRGRIILVLVAWWSASTALARPYFLNDRGEKVELVPAPDRIVVELTAGACKRLDGWPQLDLTGAGIIRRGQVTELALSSSWRGRGAEVIDRLLDAGLAKRAGAIFYEPGGVRTVSLDRQLIFKLRSPHAALDWLADVGLRLVARRGTDASVVIARAADAHAALEASVIVSGREDVAWALPDFNVPVDLFHQPNDPYYPSQWHHHQANGADISTDEAWDVTRGDSRVIVAVIDTGVQLDHQDFDPARMATGFDATDGDNDPTPLTGSIDAHGTACAGEIVATADNNVGIAGVCPQCTLMPIRMMDGAGTTDLASAYTAIEYATQNGAWVISNSWGNLPEDMIAPFKDAVLDAVTNGRGGQGAVVLFASGNGDPFTGRGKQIDSFSLQNMPQIMAVGGSGPGDMRVRYSDFGPNLSIVAPTGDMDAMNFQNPFDGPQIVTTDTFGNTGGFSRDGFYYMWNPIFGNDQKTNFTEDDSAGHYTHFFNGTSAACPNAAGVVALTLSANPELTGEQARLVVEQTADKVGDETYDANGHNDYYGNGRVNAARAVRAAVYGFGNPQGSICAEDFNCAQGECVKANPDDPTGICGTPCSTNTECADGETCAPVAGGGKICLPACSGHGDCAGGAVCVDGICMAISCSDGSECPTGTACPGTGTERHCQPSCTADQECEPPELCLPALGGNLCQAIACTDGSECPAQTACPAQGGHCLRTCASDLDCTQPELCLPAEGGNLCQAIACTTSEDCPAQTACPLDGGHCVRSCQDDSDCIPPEKCLPSGDGHLCQKVACSANDDCPGDMECGPDGFCVPTTDACTIDQNCPEGWRCVNGYCFDPGGNGSSGCGCAQHARGSGPLAILLLGMGMLIRRRRPAR